MATSSFSDADEYGFERSDTFDYQLYGDFMSTYLTVLAKRNKKWSDLLKSRRKLKKNSTLKRYVRKGIPNVYRKEIWMTVSGAQELKDDNRNLYTTLKSQTYKKSIVDMIETDIPRTFPDNKKFNKGDQEYSKKLFKVLVTYAHHNPEVGYCQGLNYIVGLILLVTEDEECSFWLLKTLVERILPKYYINTMAGLITDIDVLAHLVSIKEPEVHKHLQDIGVPWAVVTTKWFVCLFAEVLPTETVLRIWDCLFYEGSKILFRVSLTLIRANRVKILECVDLAALIDCFKAIIKDTHVVRCHNFIEDIFKMPGSLSSKSMMRLRTNLAHSSKKQN